MVTPTSDLFFGVKGQQKGPNLNFVRSQRLMCQIVGLGQMIKSSHSDPDVRPILGGQRSSERSNFQLCLILVVDGLNFRLAQGSKVVMVTPPPDPFFRVKDQQKGRNTCSDTLSKNTLITNPSGFLP